MASKRTLKPVRLSDWNWSPVRDLAAERVAIDNLTDAQISEESGVARRTLSDWKLVPEFAERVIELRAKYREDAAAVRAKIRNTGFAITEERVKRKNARLHQLEQIRIARGKAALTDQEWLDNGGATGLVTRRERSVGQGPTASITVDFAVDGDLIRTEAMLDEAIAKELGQHIVRQEIEVRDNSAAAAMLDEKLEGLARRLSSSAKEV